MFLTIFLILFLLLILYLLFVPVVFFIDTTTNEYYIQLKGLAKASIVTDTKEVLKIKLKITFFNFYFYPLKKKNPPKKKEIVKRNEIRTMKRIGLRKGVRMLRSFKVKRILLDIDTGDWILNSKLYPIFGFLNYHVGTFNINFEGRNRLALHMQNRPIYILKSFIKT